MEGNLSKCGYRCDLCPAFETNLKDDADKQRMRDALAKYYGFEMPAEDIKPCQGCQCADTAPDASCPVFPCASERGMETCGHCPDFGCNKLKERMDVVEECLKKHPDIPQEDYEAFFKPYLSRQVLENIHQSLEH